MTRIVVDTAVGHDAKLVEMWVEAWQATMPAIDFESRRPWLASELARLRADGAVVLVAFVGDEPAGFLSVTPTGRVDQVAVAPRHQRQGVGTILLEAARERSHRPLSLTVNADNPRAIRFYERHGLRCVGSGVNATSGLPVLHMES